MTRIVLVDDHTLVRQSIATALSAEPGFEVVAQTGRGDEAIELIARWQPDVAVLDINLPNADGFEVLRASRAGGSNTRVVFVTMHTDDVHVRRALGLGADGYVPKSSPTEELVAAIRTVAAGGSYLSPSLARMVMQYAGQRSRPVGTLTEREFEILELLASGTRVQDIGQHVFLSTKTVKNHLTSIYAKLGVAGATQAVGAAHRRGLVSPPVPVEPR